MKPRIEVHDGAAPISPADTDVLSLRTIIYFLVAIVIILIGLLLVVSGAKTDAKGVQHSGTILAVGASMLAGGLATLGFGVIRYFDDKDARRSERAVFEAFQRQMDANERLRSLVQLSITETMMAPRITSPAMRCVDDSDVSRHFRDEFSASMDGTEPIRVDVMGLKLFRFLSDQLDWIESINRNTLVRLLLQHPETNNFSAICTIEGRSVETAKNELQRTLQLLGRPAGNFHAFTINRGLATIETRFYKHYQPVTLFRVEGVLYVRPRIYAPSGTTSRFYEVYRRSESRRHFEDHLAHFQNCYDNAEAS